MNGELSFDNKTFISVSRASQETGYTQDYLGQLSRASKIPARMVGRTWYVDKEAVLDYKNYKKSLKEKNKQIEESQSSKNERSFRSNSFGTLVMPYSTPFAYKSSTAPFLPLIKKSKETLTSAAQPAINSFITSPVFKIAIGLVAVVLFVSGIQIAFPRQAEIATLELSHISDTFLDQNIFAALFRNANPSALAASQVGKTTTTSTLSTAAAEANLPTPSSDGVVAFPETADHANAVATVQSDFSDDTNVTFDKEGTSGVITPVFKAASSSVGYAFVMVPIKKAK